MNIPSTAERIRIRPVALGEATGHHHSFASLLDRPDVDELIEMYEDTDGTIYVRVTDAGVALTHQEHKAHEVPVADYIVRIQEQVTDWGVAPVVD